MYIAVTVVFGCSILTLKKSIAVCAVCLLIFVAQLIELVVVPFVFVSADIGLMVRVLTLAALMMDRGMYYKAHEEVTNYPWSDSLMVMTPSLLTGRK